MAASDADSSTPVVRVAVGNSSTLSHRFSLVEEARELSGSLQARFTNLWGLGESAASSTFDGGSGNLTSGFLDASRPTQLTGSALSINDPHFRHRVVKSTSSRVSITSQPVLVRTYSAVERSRPSSANPSLRHTTQPMPAKSTIPSVDAFSFDGILRAIEPEINEAIDGIAEIYARSRLSLADEYGSHLPPQGEIASSRLRHSGLAIRTMGMERTLTTVTEASSSSERLAGGSRAPSVASGKGKVTAYGSLRSIISRGRSSSHGSSQVDSPTPRLRPMLSTWSIAADKHPSITITKQASAPSQLSFASAADVSRNDAAIYEAQQPKPNGGSSSPLLRPTTWFTWRNSWSSIDAGLATQRLDATTALKGVLHGVGSINQEARGGQHNQA